MAELNDVSVKGLRLRVLRFAAALGVAEAAGAPVRNAAGEWAECVAAISQFACEACELGEAHHCELGELYDLAEAVRATVFASNRHLDGHIEYAMVNQARGDSTGGG